VSDVLEVAATESVAGLVLAAGEGRRLGEPKALLRVGGQRLVDRAVGTLAEAACRPVHVVAGAVDLDVAGAVVVRNPHWAAGMGSSLRAGIASLPDDVEAVVVTLVDTPAVTAEVVARLVASWRTGATAVVAAYYGRWRTPVLLAREHWDEVTASAVGDVGARAFLAAHSGLVVEVECGDLAQWRDIDTPADLASFEP
jgi:nicotine blue oxidoreductase